jgi:hypothetical protein
MSDKKYTPPHSWFSLVYGVYATFNNISEQVSMNGVRTYNFSGDMHWLYK